MGHIISLMLRCLVPVKHKLYDALMGFFDRFKKPATPAPKTVVYPTESTATPLPATVAEPVELATTVRPVEPTEPVATPAEPLEPAEPIEPAAPVAKVEVRTPFGQTLRKYSSQVAVGLLIVAGAAGWWFLHKPASRPVAANDFLSLSADDTGALKPLSGSKNSSGQVLTVNAASNFKDNASFDKDVSYGGNLSGLGPATFSSTLSVEGATSFKADASMQGSLSVAKSLNVSGDANFGGTLSVGTLKVNNLVLTGPFTLGSHLVTSGGQPTVKLTSQAGGGASFTISGTDTTGTIVVHMGSSPGVGDLLTATFKTAYSGTPKVILTPVGIDSTGLLYYVSRTAGFFIIGSATAPIGTRTYIFDYMVAQ